MTTSITIGTFNVENLFLRYKFFYPTMIKKGETEEQAKKREEKENAKFIEFREKGLYINNLERILEDKKTIGPSQTSNTANAILPSEEGEQRVMPDIMALQEVENMEALKKLNSKYLKSYFGYRMLIEGNDLRMINVCVLSKLPITQVRTNIQVADPVTKKELFSRDCLEVGIGLENGGDTVLTLFVNHLKSQLERTDEGRQRAKEKRRRQAQWVADMLKRRYGPHLRGGNFIVLGDFNAHHDAEELGSLLKLDGLENVVQTRPLKIPGQDAISDKDRWTYYYEDKKTTSQFDYILLSPTLAEKSAGEQVVIEKRGLGKYVRPYTGERFKGVGERDTEASDHCAVFTTVQL